MYCTNCGVELKDDDRFCCRCGARSIVGRVESPHRVLARDMANKKVSGVCAGFARYWDLDVTLVRILWLAIAVTTGGLGFLAYLAAAIVMPKDTNPRVAADFVPNTSQY
jgi:phage shock protein C